MMPERDQSSGRRFHLEELIGEGAFGEVYLAEQDSGAGFRRKVAIKLLHTDVAEMSKDAGRRMRDEARILGRLSHRNIVAVLDLIKLGDRWAIIMDFVPGGDLEMVLEALEKSGETFPLPAALEIGTAILNALDAVFTADDGQGNPMGVIHRDIKPSNVRLTVHGEIKVLDFGVARVNMDTREAQTRATGWIGTERYMSPERILCEGDGAEGDVYAAIATIAELLLGRPLGRTPVLDDRHTPWIDEALAEIKERVEGDAAVVDEVLDWLRRGLATRPEDRPSARELSDALGPLARSLPGEGVEAFSRRFMPNMDVVLGHERRPATGVLSEDTGETVSTKSRTPSPSHTFDSRSLDTPAGPPPRSETGSAGGNRAVVAGAFTLASLAFAGAVLFLFVGFALLYNSSSTNTHESESSTTASAPAPQAAPEATPDAEPEATPDAEPEAAPDAEPEAAPDAEPEATPEPAAITPAPRPTAPAPTPTADPNAPIVRAALVVLPDASSLTIQCSGVEGNGTASARIRNFPAGPCEIEAIYLNKSYTTTVTVERQGEVTCVVDGGEFQCS